MPASHVDPRTARTRRVVLDAAVEVIAEHGFSGTTIHAVAARSGVARSTIYRNWNGRTELLLEAVRDRFGTVRALVEGEVRRDLLALGRRLAKVLTEEPMASLAASLVLESRRDPDLRELHRRFVAWRMQEFSDVVDEAKARGELPGALDGMTVAADMGSAIFFRAMVLRVPIEPDWLEAHVDDCLNRYGAA